MVGDISREKDLLTNGALYLVGTPIGNLEDISFRALAILKNVNKIISEKPATTKKLLTYYKIYTPVSAYHEHLKKSGPLHVIRWLLNGESVALASEAGMPAISDPGRELVNACHENNIPVTVIPGACALVCAISLSGFPSQAFTFAGFVPRKKGERSKFLATYASCSHPVVFYESPRRILDTLAELSSLIGIREVFICRELTKFHEETIKGTAMEIVNKLNLNSPKGEITVVLSGAVLKEKNPTDDEILAAIKKLEQNGTSNKEIIKKISCEFNLPKNKAYSFVLRYQKQKTARIASVY